jgi:hypothetical protein
MDILDQIPANPAPVCRLGPIHQKAMLDFVRALQWDRDMDSAIGVALGIAMIINQRRGLPPAKTAEHVRRVAHRVVDEWTGRG